MKVKRAKSKHAVATGNVTCIEKDRAGHPTVFTQDEEIMFLKTIRLCHKNVRFWQYFAAMMQVVQ